MWLTLFLFRSHTAVAIGGDKSADIASAGSSPPAASKARSLPVGTIAQILSDKLGKPVSPNASGINGGMASIFGGDAGKLMMKFAASQMKGGGAGSNPLTALLSGAGGGGGGAAMLGGLAVTAMASGMGKGSGDKNPLSSILAQLGLGGSDSVTAAGAPPFIPTDDPLGDDCGILITGCQNTQTSADVRPANGKPHGALTAAIAKAFKANPNCSYREVSIINRLYMQLCFLLVS
jgi:hypothetical protein